jgi:AcrR family transcriptional regulator
VPAAGSTPNRKQLARAAAERSLKDAALKLLRRDGLLAGLNLQEVADVASVNRGLIHRWFGSRRELLRAAIRSQRERLAAEVADSLDRPVEARTEWAVRQYAADPSHAQMVMLLCLDSDESIEPIPYLPERLEAFAAEIARGRWSADADPLALTVLWDVILDGYFTMRDALVRQTGLTPSELDERVFASVGQLFRGVLPAPDRHRATDPPDVPDAP